MLFAKFANSGAFLGGLCCLLVTSSNVIDRRSAQAQNEARCQGMHPFWEGRSVEGDTTGRSRGGTRGCAAGSGLASDCSCVQPRRAILQAGQGTLQGYVVRHLRGTHNVAFVFVCFENSCHNRPGRSSRSTAERADRALPFFIHRGAGGTARRLSCKCSAN